MSFAIWTDQPPFTLAANGKDQVFKVGNVWVVTDDPTKADQASVDAIMKAPPDKPSKQQLDKLAALGLTPKDLRDLTKP